MQANQEAGVTSSLKSKSYTHEACLRDTAKLTDEAVVPHKLIRVRSLGSLLLKLIIEIKIPLKPQFLSSGSTLNFDSGVQVKR